MKYIKYIGGYDEYEGIELHIGEVYKVSEFVVEYKSNSPNIPSVLIFNNKGKYKRYIIKDSMDNFFFEDVTQEYVRNKIIIEILE